jgi:hypothetical protein
MFAVDLLNDREDLVWDPITRYSVLYVRIHCYMLHFPLTIPSNTTPSLHLTSIHLMTAA